MIIVAFSASLCLSPSPPLARRSTNTTSSRPPQNLSSRCAHTRRSHPRPRKSASCSPLMTTKAALHPAATWAIRPRPQNLHRSRPAKPRLFLPAVSSLRGFRTPAPRPVPASPAKGRRPKPFSLAVMRNRDRGHCRRWPIHDHWPNQTAPNLWLPDHAR